MLSSITIVPVIIIVLVHRAIAINVNVVAVFVVAVHRTIVVVVVVAIHRAVAIVVIDVVIHHAVAINSQENGRCKKNIKLNQNDMFEHYKHILVGVKEQLN